MLDTILNRIVLTASKVRYRYSASPCDRAHQLTRDDLEETLIILHDAIGTLVAANDSLTVRLTAQENVTKAIINAAKMDSSELASRIKDLEEMLNVHGK